jgi:hypothetical protein
MNIEDIFKKQTCYFNGEEKKGKVLAVSTYVNRRRVCFQIEGEKKGEWFLESELFGTSSENEVIQKESRRYTHTEKTAKKEVESDIYAKEQAEKEEEAKKKAEQDIHALVKFVADTQNAIQHQATKDIKTVVRFFGDTQKAMLQSIQTAVKTVEDTSNQACQWLDQATQGSGQLVTSLHQTITNFWNRYWLERLIELIKIIDAEKVRDTVRKVKHDYPTLQPSQIAEHLISEKAIWATATGLMGGIAPGLTTIPVDLFATLPLLVQMVYEISFAYEDDLQVSERSGEILTIFGLALGSEQLTKLGVGFLFKHSPIPNWGIGAATNVIMFLTVGYATREFYEAKVKGMASPITSAQAYRTLEKKINTYLEEAIAEKSSIEATVVEAVAVKEHLVLS